MAHKILFSNIGYAKGIDGSLSQHICRFGRHLYSTIRVQEEALQQLRDIIAKEEPDLCCFVEIDQGSFYSARFNQLYALINKHYRFFDIANKYGEKTWINSMPLHRGKSNAFLAKFDYPFNRLYFRNGTKRLIYQIELSNNIVVFFAHFSLNKKVRQKQFLELQELISKTSKQVMVLADFNIMAGFKELENLLQQSGLVILNEEDQHTFTFHRRKLALDLCLCSKSLANTCHMTIILQPFSDHHALLVEISA